MSHNVTTDGYIAHASKTDLWSIYNDTYYVQAGSGGLQALILDMLVNNYDGTIMLGPGTHDISWTDATTIDQSITFQGVPGKSIIRFTQNLATKSQSPA